MDKIDNILVANLVNIDSVEYRLNPKSAGTVLGELPLLLIRVAGPGATVQNIVGEGEAVGHVRGTGCSLILEARGSTVINRLGLSTNVGQSSLGEGKEDRKSGSNRKFHSKIYEGSLSSKTKFGI